MKKGGYYASRICMFASFAIVVITVVIIYLRQDSSFLPLLVVGFMGGCISTPFYYYYKAKAKSVEPYRGIDVKTLNDYAEMDKEKKNSPKQ